MYSSNIASSGFQLVLVHAVSTFIIRGKLLLIKFSDTDDALKYLWYILLETLLGTELQLLQKSCLISTMLALQKCYETFNNVKFQVDYKNNKNKKENSLNI
ncbi:hypothetical protein J437_LFUL008108 [Ladona fulva]|uniref:Uncharacterized protein n=1 Tax=Ladona fulva TaxID=123851 RepID=A0A8K0NY07_LADFU|nr:hypothetical protein J437_LFUL008108 [Ladona fulva]